MRPSIVRRGRATNWRVALVLATTLAFPATGRASLGSGMASVQSDQTQMKGSVRIVGAEGYAIHELHAPTGTVVREYVLSSGTVFAIAWQGPFLPNLRQLLGGYFEPYSQAALAQRAHRPGHGPVLIQLPGLVVQSSGHMRAFFGRAYIPELLPPGIEAEGIR
jgi:hypothetical protein